MQAAVLWISVAFAAPVQADRLGMEWREHHADVTEDNYDLLLEEAVGRAPVGSPNVSLWREGHTHGPFHPPAPVQQTTKPGEGEGYPSPLLRAEGALAGKAIYASQCHGWKWSDVLDRFATQRGQGYGIVEDLVNPEGMDQFLMGYLEQAGASVYTTRERDLSDRMYLLDDGESGYTEDGDGFEDGLAGFARRDAWPYGVDPFDEGGTRRFRDDGTSTVEWTPEIEEGGRYAVYVSWDASTDHVSSAHYRITHPGGVFDRYFDQTVHGSTWQYVDTLWLDAGTSLSVALISDGAEPDKYLSADAVRVGGGLDDVSRHGEVTGRARWQSAAIHYAQFNGAPTSVYDPYGDGPNEDDGGSDPPTRSLWAAWEHPVGEDAIYLSWHSNASDSVGGEGGGGRGTVTYMAGGGPDAPSSAPSQCSRSAVEGSYTLASLLQTELVDRFRDVWSEDWSDRGIGTACFSEVSPTNNPEMPAALVELAFHDNAADASYIRHPGFRRDAARAMYRGVVRYFAERDGYEAVYLPEPPQAVAVRHDATGELVADWAPGPSGGTLGDVAERYRVQTSRDGRSWDEGVTVTGLQATIQVDAGALVFVRVVGLNDGGISFPSTVVGARRSPDGSAPILVIDAFDRFDDGLLQWVYPHSSLGAVARMDLDRMNRGDLIVAHGHAVAAAGYFFDGVSDEAIDDELLSAYELLIWGLGEESSADETFDADAQRRVVQHVSEGGALWVSGSEVLWDLDAMGDEDDRWFASEMLGAWMAADASGSNTVDGEGLLEGVEPMDFGWSYGGAYPVEWPDTLDTDRDVVARYGSGEVAAVYEEGVVFFGFPFEAIGEAGARDAVAARLLPELIPNYTPPDAGETNSGDVEVTDPVNQQGQISDAPPFDVSAPDGCGCVATPVGVPSAPLTVPLGLLLWSVSRRRPR
jgi:hypothetical protein